jgi:phytoene desaturase
VIFFYHPNVTDPSLAPEGKSTFQAVVPVANTGKLALDWSQIGSLLEKRVLDEIGRRLVPDIHDRVVTSFHLTPRDFALDFNAHLGNGWGMVTPKMGGIWRHGHRDSQIENLYFVGASTAPGAGIPNVLSGAKLATKLLLERYLS